MMNQTLLLPLCAQILLTLVVWIVLFVTRVGTIFKKKINPQLLADEKNFELLKEVDNPSDNFENLFEMPVLFYVLILVLLITQTTDPIYAKGAWAFVIFRAIHSFIHCTYNRVMHRFRVYIVSSGILWAMWIKFTLQVIQG